VYSEVKEASMPNQDRRSPGFWVGVWRSFRLAWQLLRDPDVPFGLKLLPLGVLGYVLWPIDLLPDTILGLGQIDDLALLLLGIQIFIALAPQAIKRRYQPAEDDIANRDWTVTNKRPPESPASREIIDGK
jgi:uncharacterized membrane protein YkvA (DUF1232 family)